MLGEAQQSFYMRLNPLPLQVRTSNGGFLVGFNGAVRSRVGVSLHQSAVNVNAQAWCVAERKLICTFRKSSSA